MERLSNLGAEIQYDSDIFFYFSWAAGAETGRIKSADVLIGSGGPGSGVSLITEKWGVLWAAAFQPGEKEPIECKGGLSLIWNSSLIFMNYESNSAAEKENGIYITPPPSSLTVASCFTPAVAPRCIFLFFFSLQQIIIFQCVSVSNDVCI